MTKGMKNFQDATLNEKLLRSVQEHQGQRNLLARNSAMIESKSLCLLQVAERKKKCKKGNTVFPGR